MTKRWASVIASVVFLKMCGDEKGSLAWNPWILEDLSTDSSLVVPG